MFQIITSLNLVKPAYEFQEQIKNIKLRGYSEDTYLTGEFALKISQKNLRSLSVGDIADTLCPEKRDLYFKKGINRPSGVRPRETWGNKAGTIVENFSYAVFNKFHNKKADKSYFGIIKKLNIFSADKSYSGIIKKLNIFSKGFKAANLKIFNKLDTLKSRAEEEPDWLLKQLNFNGRLELGLKLLHRNLSKNGVEINLKDLKINQNSSIKINPTPAKIGISKGVSPDFLIERHGIVGDIKSGFGGFQDRYLLTCIGYALAYENEKGKGCDINFGIIYFFPTRYSKCARRISFSQVYIFLIDDDLRRYFINTRNDAYNIISKRSFPQFPKEKENCSRSRCKFYQLCVKNGLSV